MQRKEDRALRSFKCLNKYLMVAVLGGFAMLTTIVLGSEEMLGKLATSIGYGGYGGYGSRYGSSSYNYSYPSSSSSSWQDDWYERSRKRRDEMDKRLEDSRKQMEEDRKRRQDEMEWMNKLNKNRNEELERMFRSTTNYETDSQASYTSSVVKYCTTNSKNRNEEKCKKYCNYLETEHGLCVGKTKEKKNKVRFTGDMIKNCSNHCSRKSPNYNEEKCNLQCAGQFNQFNSVTSTKDSTSTVTTNAAQSAQAEKPDETQTENNQIEKPLSDEELSQSEEIASEAEEAGQAEMTVTETVPKYTTIIDKLQTVFDWISRWFN